ncbi:TPA: GNAT family N-acetyltransferase [Enterococcus hirae]
MMKNKQSGKTEHSEEKSIVTLEQSTLPWSLLLDADPEEENVQRYIDQGAGFIWKAENDIQGVIVFLTNKLVFEIMNLAVAPKVQGQGIGYALLTHTLKEMKKLKTTQQQVIIRTGSTSSSALQLYKKIGFLEISREKDYFVKNYKQPIYENGQRLRDQVTLAKKI